MPERFIRRLFKNFSAKDEIRITLPAIYPRLWRFALALTGQRHAADEQRNHHRRPLVGDGRRESEHDAGDHGAGGALGLEQGGPDPGEAGLLQG